MSRLKRDERGLSQSVQLAVILPTLMLVTLGIIQAGLWIHGHDVAIRAANAAADVARGSYGRTAEAERRAEDLAVAGGLSDVVVNVQPGPVRVAVTVSGHVPLMFDVGLGRISESATAPLERMTQP